jgi:hypothetical protein
VRGLPKKYIDFMTHGRTRRAAKGAFVGRAEAAKSRRLRGYGALGAGGAALGAGGGGAAYLAGRDKQSSDYEIQEAIQERAWQHLMASGLADEQGNFIPAESLYKTASDDQLEYDIDAAALELLESEGYPVEWY